MEYLKKYIPFIKNLKAADFNFQEVNTLLNDKAYMLWLQGEIQAPEIVQKCIQSVRKYFGENLIILDNSTLWEYFSLPSEIKLKWENKKIIPANFSDIVRISLLYDRGGYWFDATDFMTSPVPDLIKNSSFFLYVTSEKLLHAMFIQTCFIRAVKGNPLIGMWKALVLEYWKNEEFSIDYFLVHKLFELLVTYNKDAKKLFSEMPKIPMDPTHILWYEIGNLPYDKEKFQKMTRAAFFQKCTYRPAPGKNTVNEILPGSIAEYVMNKSLSINEI